MGRLLFFLVAPSLLVSAGHQKRKPPKEPEILVVEMAARRSSDGRVEIDGRIRSQAARPLERLTLYFKMRAPSDEVVTTQKGQLDATVLEPGEDSEFHWQMRDHVRAVKVNIEITDRNGDEILVDKPGPYPIE